MIFRFILFVALLFFPLCGQPADSPNIVWINIEDLDDTLGCYGDDYAITPNLDALAKEGILYRNAFANAPICAPARNCLITGMYPTSIGGQHLRCEIELPDFIKPFPVYMKQAGYFVTNQAKTDYNFSPDGIYDYWRNDLAPWKRRKSKDQPFFSFFVLGTTHEGPGNNREKYDKATSGLAKEKFHDPEKAKVPPYFPNTPKMRELWARYYDLVSAVDEQIGEIIGNLKNDGLWENTIVIFFSDHGHGLPRHKRWLFDSGLRVPLIIRFPDKYQQLAPGDPGSEIDRLVSFVDFAPTTLNLAGVPVPDHMQGSPFCGANPGPERNYVYGTRDRADDMFELSRAVHDGRYLYVRNFLPHLPWLQGGRIFGNQKESLAELRRARDAGELDEISGRIFAQQKTAEEFYDLKEDRFEIRNAINDPRYTDKIQSMREELKRWVINHRDVGFLTESDYTQRAEKAGISIYEMAQNDQLYDLPNVFAAASGKENANSFDPAVVYWKIVRGEIQDPEELKNYLQHPVPSIAVAAAERLCRAGHSADGLPILEKHIASDDLRLALEAARAMFQIGELAKPSVEKIEQVRKGLEGPKGEKRRYRDFNYASFTGWALEWTLINCGAARPEDFE